MNGPEHEIDAIPAGNSAGTSSTCCSLLLSLPTFFLLSRSLLERSSPAALIVFLIRTRRDGIMYTANYSDTSATRDTPNSPPQTRHPDFIIASPYPSLFLSVYFWRDVPLNLFACKFVRPFLSGISFRRSSRVPVQKCRHCPELLQLHGSNFFPKSLQTFHKSYFN